MTETSQVRERETPEASEPVVEKPRPEPIPDPSPRFGSSPVSMLIWASLSASLLGIVVGGLYQSSTAFLASAISGTVSFLLFRMSFSRSRVAKTVRKGLVRLPVLRELEVQRIGALAGVAATTCDRCASFDLAVGQHALQQNGDFALAARFLRPGQMQKVKSGPWTEDRGFDSRGQPVDEGGPDWSQMGGCRRLGKLVFAPQTCREWS